MNGADGIGTGWSTSVPNYNPRQGYRTGAELFDRNCQLVMLVLGGSDFQDVDSGVDLAGTGLHCVPFCTAMVNGSR